MAFLIDGRRILTGDGEIRPARLLIEEGMIAAVDAAATSLAARPHLDAGDRLVLPGIVDLHGDAFERQLMPRPGVRFSVDLGLLETDRQLLANGITTAFHAVTWSWEPGLRGADTVHEIIAGWKRLRGRLGCDTRLHLRFETHNLDAVAQVADWLADGTIGLLAFNDHVDDTADELESPDKAARYAERSGLDVGALRELLDTVRLRAPAVPDAVARLAAAARAANVAMLSHDDAGPEVRSRYAALGCRIAEFPVTEAAAAAARAAGDPVVMGAPNVLRGGSHKRVTAASDMVARGLCTILASDYYYPALPAAPFRLAAERIVDLAAAWALVSANPADAAGLSDRGRIAQGQRADLLLVDDRDPALPHIAATLVAGRPHLIADPALTIGVGTHHKERSSERSISRD